MVAIPPLAGRVALVTGASSGLGRHFARVLAEAGAAVAVAARRLPELETLAAGIGAGGGRAAAVEMDVRDTASVEAAVALAEERLGTPEILVNCAGIAATRAALEQDEAEWQAILDTNLSGAWRTARAVAGRLLAAKRGGAIVNIGSILGLRSARNVSAYAAAKAALHSLTQGMALEFARAGIRVNALAPGYIATDLNREFLSGPAGQRMLGRVPLGRFGEPEDLDGALLMLASDAGRYMTGSVVVVDGGHTLGFL